MDLYTNNNASVSIVCLILLIITIGLDNLEDMLFSCAFQFNFELINIPKKIMLSTILIFTLFIIIFYIDSIMFFFNIK